MIMQKSDMGAAKPKISQETDKEHVGGTIRASTTTGNGDADLLDFKVMNEARQMVSTIQSEAGLIVEYVVRLNKNFDRPAFGIIVRDRVGRSVYETTTFAQLGELGTITKDATVIVRYSFCFNVRMGQYSFSAGISNRGYSRSEFEEHSLLMHDVAQIQVTENPDARFYGGQFNLRPQVNVSATVQDK